MNGSGPISGQKAAAVGEVHAQALEKADKSDQIEAGGKLIKASTAQKWKARFCRAVLGLGGLRKKTHAKYDVQFKAITSYLKQGRASLPEKTAPVPDVKLSKRAARSFNPAATYVSPKGSAPTHGSHRGHSPESSIPAATADSIKENLAAKTYIKSDKTFNTEALKQDLQALSEPELKTLINERTQLVKSHGLDESVKHTLVGAYAEARVAVKLDTIDNPKGLDTKAFQKTCVGGWNKAGDVKKAIQTEATRQLEALKRPPLPESVIDTIPTGEVDLSQIKTVSKNIHAALTLPSAELHSKEDLVPKEEIIGDARFKNILPPKSTALKQGDKYLAASFVGDKFIATQAPMKPGTTTNSNESIPAFYGMLMTHGVDTVAHLANEHDTASPRGGASLQIQYWPDEGHTQQYGDIPVTTKQIEKGSDFNIITLQVGEESIYSNTGEGSKEVKVYHYHKWPDLGIPTGKQAQGFTQFTDSLAARNAGDRTVVHCKAGVGRTGSLIVISQLSEAIKKGEVTRQNLLQKTTDLIWQGRQERGPQFVQTAVQIEFVVQQALIELDRKDGSTTDEELYQNVTHQGRVKDDDTSSLSSVDSAPGTPEPVKKTKAKQTQGISSEALKGLGRTPAPTANSIIAEFKAGQFEKGANGISFLSSKGQLSTVGSYVETLKSNYQRAGNEDAVKYCNWLQGQIQLRSEVLNNSGPKSQVDNPTQTQGKIK